MDKDYFPKSTLAVALGGDKDFGGDFDVELRSSSSLSSLNFSLAFLLSSRDFYFRSRDFSMCSFIFSRDISLAAGISVEFSYFLGDFERA